MSITPYVLLLYPPIQLMDIETPRPDGSLGPLYLAAALEAEQIPTDILDASVGTPEQSIEDTFNRTVRQESGLNRIGMEVNDIAEYVRARGYTAVGIHSNFTPQTRLVFETARAIKQTCPSVRIYAGGVNARAMKDRFLRTGLFDAVCLTEGELIFPKVVRAHAEGKTLDGIAGVAQRGATNPVDASCFPRHLDDLPMPAWHKLPLDKYEAIASPHGVEVSERKERRYAPVMTSRGCPFACSYCHISSEKRENSLTGAVGMLRTHSVQRVIDEIDTLQGLGIRRLFFEDDSLLADKARVKEIFKRVRDRNLLISNVNGVNLIHFFSDRSFTTPGKWPIDVEYLEILRAAGFDQIVFPVESGSPRILTRHATNKVILDRMDLVELMRTMTRVGIMAPVNMMIGFPDETEREIQQSIDLAQRLRDAGAPYVTFFIPIPFPGSRLHEMALAGGHLDADFDPDIMNWKRPVMKNTAVPAAKLEEIRDWANEKINTDKHVRLRLEHSVGFRWQSNEKAAMSASTS
jgi:anaerobic magnesium-protoporphyrin IX monomethyl ester cyclase